MKTTPSIEEPSALSSQRLVGLVAHSEVVNQRPIRVELFRSPSDRRSSGKTAVRVLRVSSDSIIIVDATFGVIRAVDLLRLMPLRGSFFLSDGPDALRLRDG